MVYDNILIVGSILITIKIFIIMPDFNNKRQRIGDTRPNTQNGLPHNNTVNNTNLMQDFNREWITNGATKEMIPLTMQLSPYVRNRLSFNRIRKMLVYPEN